MIYFLFALLTSFWAAWLTIRLAHRWKFGGDEADGVQKFHDHWVPRLGGLPVYFAFCSAALLQAKVTGEFTEAVAYLIVASLPAFAIGLLEDTTRKAGVISRWIFTMIAAGLGWWLLEAQLLRLDVPGVDTYLANNALAAFLFTTIAVAGVAHSINLIDGYNGLSGFFVAVVLASIGLVAWQVGDSLVSHAAFTLTGAVIGFLLWNFPNGRIFFGDAGAYVCGFFVAELSVLLVARNPEISAWFPLLLVVYPVWETFFSMYRRVGAGWKNMFQPDALHLHHLIYRRLLRNFVQQVHPNHRQYRNAATSIYVWLLSSLCAVAAVTLYKNTEALQISAVAAAIFFTTSYRWLAKHRPRRSLAVKKPLATLQTK